MFKIKTAYVPQSAGLSKAQCVCSSLSSSDARQVPDTVMTGWR